MVRIISALILAVTVACATAQEAIELAADAPDRHVVVPGDTLWSIAGKFLRSPWRWPDVWRLNRDQIRNPHRIYPGDIVVLDRSSGQPRLAVANRVEKTVRLQPQVHSTPVRREIPSIPAAAIEPFISQPLVVEAHALDGSPRIVATQEDRVFLASGDTAFVAGIDDARMLDWQVYRPGRPLKDPETGNVLGFESFFLGNARLVTPGNPAVVRILSAKEEIGRGDHLVPAAPPGTIAQAPHAPGQAVNGRIMSIYGGLNEAGKHAVISLNRGSREGLEAGHVLALFRKRAATIQDDRGRRETLELPEDRYGLIFVFRTFDHVAYALVMDASRPVIVGDAARNP